MEKFYIAIVGHTDHGKSTLIGRILHDTGSLPEGRMEEIAANCKSLGREFEFAYITDAFLEERQKEMTIDTTQVVFKTPQREYTIIDTPGHKELLKNMVTGASYAEAAILIVSAKDGIQGQTKRHAYILKLFGIKQIIIAVNKMDEISYSQEAFESLSIKLNYLFARFGLQAPDIIPISAKCGDNVVSLSKNMPWYQGKAIASALDSFKKVSFQYHFRMPVQDIYRLDDKNVIVGKISSGKIKRGEKVFVLPLKEEARVVSIKVFEGEKEEAMAGESVGLILESGNAPKRGDIISALPFPKMASKFLALTLCLEYKLFKGVSYVLQCATQQAACKITKVEDHIDIATLEDVSDNFISRAEISKVSITADSELVYEEFNELHELGRFVLRKDNDIIAAGVII